MKELTNIYQEAGQQFIDDLFKDYLLVTEKLSGSSFSFERHGDQILFFKGSNKMPINLIDRTLMMYYEQAIQYMMNSVKDNLKDIPEYWRFCFQYFVNNKPGAIEYDNLPTNNLVLTHIQVRNAKGKIAKVIEDPRVLRDWASAFQVTPLIPIFSGYLKEHQKKKIREFLSIPKEDHLEVFGTNSFAQYLITCLNPNVISTTLQNDLNKPIDSIIFKFFKPGTSQVFTAKMIDPYTQALMKNKEPVDLRRAPADINEILLLDILAFIEERGLRSGELLSDTPPERYLELISTLFNDYIAKRGNDLKKLNIEKAEFAKGPEFNLNIDLIKNNRTKELLQKSESLQNLYKIMLGSLRKKRNPNRIGAVMTKNVVDDFNKLVVRISDAINKETDGKFKTFGDYLTAKVTEEVDEKGLEALIVEEKVLNYNKFINLGKVEIVTEKLSNKAIQKNWLNAYQKIMKSRDSAGAKSKEVLRASFGANDGEAEKSIKAMLKKLRVKDRSYTVEEIDNATFIPEIGMTLSGQFNTYKITFNTGVKILNHAYLPGESIYITNRYKVSKKTGEAAVIKTKDITPDAMGLPTREYHNAQPLMSAIKSYVDRTSYPDRYKEFIVASAEAVINDSKNNGLFRDFETYANYGSAIIYNVGVPFFEGIDQVSVANFSNDFGEVLGGLMMFNVIKDTGDGLRYPTASNERLVDFYFDDYRISSKAGSGGTPSGSTIMGAIDNAVKKGDLSLDVDQTDFYDYVVKPWLNPPKLDKSTIYNSVMKLADDQLGPNQGSGYSYLLQEGKFNSASVTRDNINKFLDDLTKEPEAFDSFLRTLSLKTGTWRGKVDPTEYREEYVKRMESGDSLRVGLVFYPIMVETAKILNEKFMTTLTQLTQKVSDVKQVYLDTKVTKGAFVFKTKKFSSANFKFEQKGFVWNPFSAMMGIKMVK